MEEKASALESLSEYELRNTSSGAKSIIYDLEARLAAWEDYEDDVAATVAAKDERIRVLDAKIKDLESQVEKLKKGILQDTLF